MLFSKRRYKYFIAYKDGGKISSLCITVPKKSVYVKLFNETKYISFLIIDSELSKNIVKLGIKLVTSSKKNFTLNQCRIKNIKELK